MKSAAHTGFGDCGCDVCCPEPGPSSAATVYCNGFPVTAGRDRGGWFCPHCLTRLSDPPGDHVAAQGQDVRDWWMLDEQAQEDNLMHHSFSGDPWGLCSRCQHPAFHEIHQETT